MSQDSVDDPPPSSEEADPVSLRDVELEPVSLHDIERILAPGRSPPKLAPSKAEPSKAEPSKAEPSKAEPSKAEPSEGLATTVQPESDDDEQAPDSAINDLRALARASLRPADRDHELDEVLHMGGVAGGSVLGDAPPPPLVPPDLAALVEKEKPTRTEGASKPRPRPPLKQKRADRTEPAGETSLEPPAAPIASTAPARSVKPRSSRPSEAGSKRPKSRPPAEKAPEKKPEAGGSRALLYLGAAAAFLGAGYWLGTRNQTPAPPAGPAPTVTVVVTERVPAEPPPAEQIESAMAREPEPSAAPSAPAGAGALPPRPEAGAIAPTTTAATTTAPPTPATTTAPTPAMGEFDKGAASAALSGAVASASACKQEGDPSGQARVQVTFAPSGRVTVANIVGPPFAGTKTGGCIALAFRSAKVPPFQGDPVTVSKTVAIP